VQLVPDDLIQANPELGSHRYLAIGDEILLVYRRQEKG
jgi:hypothetical protein